MHPYSSDIRACEGMRWIFFLLSLGIAYLFHILISSFGLKIPWYIESPSPFCLYCFFLFVYDKWLWKKSFGIVHLSNIPDYSGVWDGELISSYDTTKKIHCRLEIKQTWRLISCRFSTDTSISYSSAARIIVQPGVTEGLTWLYTNKPNNLCAVDMHSHNGVTQAKLENEGILHCEYFNCARDRHTYGKIILKKISPL